jgi:predicted nucleotidyltransferase
MVYINQDILNTVRDRLIEKFQPQKIVIFGSVARGQNDNHSDLDILVICPVVGSRRQLMVQMNRSLGGLELARDILILTPEEFDRDKNIPGTIARPAWKEGIVLYDRQAE